ncbi:MAG: hypothetical protein C5B49_13180 [Bdellovibrio sp.]|nr:MAG: hypothetical protein C5B49_13180 [Bdellovibrio sp.]
MAVRRPFYWRSDTICAQVHTMKFTLLSVLLLSVSAFAKEGVSHCGSINPRPLVARLISRHVKHLAGDPKEAQNSHLSEFSPLAIKLADQARDMLAPQADLRAAIDRYVQELQTSKYLSYEILEYPPDKIIELLLEIQDLNIEEEIRNTVKTRNLTIGRMLDLGMRWSILMTVNEFVRSGRQFRLTERESFRLWQFLAGHRDALVALFPLAYFHFHQDLMSVESVVGTSSRPILPLQLTPKTLHHVAENESMSPVESLLHDIHHSRIRLSQSLKWIFPDPRGASPYFLNFKPKTPVIEKKLEITPQWVQTARASLEAQEKFHNYIFTRYSSFPENVKAAIELIWFRIYFAVPQRGNDVAMTASGLESMVHNLSYYPFHLRKVAEEARTGGFGTRYEIVYEASLEKAIKDLKKLAKEYRPDP